MIEASFNLIDVRNPSIGYQLRIRNAENGVDLLFTSKAPDTGENLLTAADCLRVIAMYDDSQVEDDHDNCVETEQAWLEAQDRIEDLN